MKLNWYDTIGAFGCQVVSVNFPETWRFLLFLSLPKARNLTKPSGFREQFFCATAYFVYFDVQNRQIDGKIDRYVKCLPKKISCAYHHTQNR